MVRWFSSGLIAMVGLLTVSCGGTAACTDAGCDHQAVVTYPNGLVTAAYDLTLSFGSGPALSARCADPGAPELADNPEEVSCDLAGFELLGEPAGQRTVFVQITDTASGDAILPNTEVRLEAVDELRPNGPDCEPVCFVRNGQVTGAAPQ